MARNTFLSATEALPAARKALKVAMDRAGCPVEVTIEVSRRRRLLGASQGVTDCTGFGVYGDEQDAVNRAAEWLTKWATKHVDVLDEDGQEMPARLEEVAHIPGPTSKVAVFPGVFKYGLALKYRALVTTQAFNLPY